MSDEQISGIYFGGFGSQAEVVRQVIEPHLDWKQVVEHPAFSEWMRGLVQNEGWAKKLFDTELRRWQLLRQVCGEKNLEALAQGFLLGCEEVCDGLLSSLDSIGVEFVEQKRVQEYSVPMSFVDRVLRPDYIANEGLEDTRSSSAQLRAARRFLGERGQGQVVYVGTHGKEEGGWDGFYVYTLTKDGSDEWRGTAIFVPGKKMEEVLSLVAKNKITRVVAGEEEVEFWQLQLDDPSEYVTVEAVVQAAYAVLGEDFFEAAADLVDFLPESRRGMNEMVYLTRLDTQVGLGRNMFEWLMEQYGAEVMRRQVEAVQTEGQGKSGVVGELNGTSRGSNDGGGSKEGEGGGGVNGGERRIFREGELLNKKQKYSDVVERNTQVRGVTLTTRVKRNKGGEVSSGSGGGELAGALKEEGKMGIIPGSGGVTANKGKGWVEVGRGDYRVRRGQNIYVADGLVKTGSSSNSNKSQVLEREVREIGVNQIRWRLAEGVGVLAGGDQEEVEKMMVEPEFEGGMGTSERDEVIVTKLVGMWDERPVTTDYTDYNLITRIIQHESEGPTFGGLAVNEIINEVEKMEWDFAFDRQAEVVLPRRFLVVRMANRVADWAMKMVGVWTAKKKRNHLKTQRNLVCYMLLKLFIEYLSEIVKILELEAYRVLAGGQRETIKLYQPKKLRIKIDRWEEFLESIKHRNRIAVGYGERGRLWLTPQVIRADRGVWKPRKKTLELKFGEGTSYRIPLFVSV